jgi:S-DNA-T family DNA segregation ATPase FtsK/SpoIIIE
MIYPRNQFALEKKPILAKDLWKHKDFEANKKNLIVPLGMGAKKQSLFLDFKKVGHLLIGGSIAAVSNEYIQTIMVSLIKKFTPKELKFIIADDAIDYTVFSKSPYLRGSFVKNAEQLLKASNEIVKEMDKRFDILSEARMCTADKYNEKSFKMPHLFLIIAEMTMFMLNDAKIAKKIEKNLISILQMGGAVNIHLIINVYKLKEKILPGFLRANFTTKISFATITKEDSEFIMDYEGAEKLCLPDEAILSIGWTGEKNPIKFRAALVTDADMAKIIH